MYPEFLKLANDLILILNDTTSFLSKAEKGSGLLGTMPLSTEQSSIHIIKSSAFIVGFFLLNSKRL